MTSLQKEKILQLQREGRGYRAIAAELDLTLDSVKSWCRRHPPDGKKKNGCQQCGAPLPRDSRQKSQRFCSDACRFAWWAKHPVQHGKYVHTCALCGREFRNSRKEASYCGRACFSRARMKGLPHE